MTPEDVDKVRDLVNSASWQKDAQTPQKFHQFLLSILAVTGDYE